jgi:hypothetical protein
LRCLRYNTGLDTVTLFFATVFVDLAKLGHNILVARWACVVVVPEHLGNRVIKSASDSGISASTEVVHDAVALAGRDFRIGLVQVVTLVAGAVASAARRGVCAAAR